MDRLGPDLWYFLHYMSLHNDLEKDLLLLFGQLFKCYACQDEFLKDIDDIIEDFDMWLFQFHNKVNKKLKKDFFDIQDLSIYQEVNYYKLTNALKCLYHNNSDSLGDILRFKKFLRKVYTLKPFLFNTQKIEKLFNDKYLGIYKLFHIK
tara:strand:- start:372 stop:818 length:447 start_codon:yes stop_codon:yes gene_type:complete